MKSNLILLLLFLLPFWAEAQLSDGPYWEAGITAGPMVFMGDLGGNYGRGTTFLKDYNLPVTRLTVGAYATWYPAEWIGVRFMLNHGELYGNDALIKATSGDAVTRKNRNLDFRTQLNEALVIAEIDPTVFLEEDPGDRQGRIRPYGLLGLGIFHFNPQGTYTMSDGDVAWVDLRPLHTEGEGFPEYPDRKMYSLTQPNIPMGFGAKYFLSNAVNISAEVLHRKTFTYYIDDVSTTYIAPSLFYKYLSPSQAAIAVAVSNKSVDGYNTPGYEPGDKRGDHTQYNAYFSFNLKVSIRLGGDGDRWRNSTHCPLIRF
ncbi:MAG TPA: hypothetical protein VGS79_17220 [Puia sp.]|nr:hypothetical protein [Puia sp.]